MDGSLFNRLFMGRFDRTGTVSGPDGRGSFGEFRRDGTTIRHRICFACLILLCLNLSVVADDGPGRRSRVLFEGSIVRVELTDEDQPASLQGFVTVADREGVRRKFRVMDWTFIMIVDQNGYGYAGYLRHLKPGWPCSLAYDLPPDSSYDDMDFAPRTPVTEIKDADNVVVYYQP